MVTADKKIMTLRVDKSVLLQAFATIEAIIVGIPMITYMIVLGSLILAGFYDLDMKILPVCFIVLFIGSFYLIPPALIAQKYIRVASPPLHLCQKDYSAGSQ